MKSIKYYSSNEANQKINEIKSFLIELICWRASRRLAGPRRNWKTLFFIWRREGLGRSSFLFFIQLQSINVFDWIALLNWKEREEKATSPGSLRSFHSSFSSFHQQSWMELKENWRRMARSPRPFNKNQRFLINGPSRQGSNQPNQTNFLILKEKVEIDCGLLLRAG